MNLEELNNNISILLKPYDNKELTPRQQHAKDTVLACQIMIRKLCEVIDDKDEALAINSRAYLKLGIEKAKAESKLGSMLVELEALKKANEELTEQNEELKKNLVI